MIQLLLFGNENTRMKLLLLSAVILVSFTCKAQSSDDFQDTRKKNESFVKLPKNNIRAEIATFALSGIDEAVGKDELQKIPFTTFGDNFMNFSGDNIKASIQIAPFDKSKHKLLFDEKYLTKIDHKTYYGNYGNIPKTYISNISLVTGGDSITLPPIAYSDLYNLKLTYTDNGVVRSRNGIYLSKDGHRIYFYIFCKDNTGSYEVTWIFQDKIYLRRVLDYGFM